MADTEQLRNFDDLLQAARNQEEPQRLLLVFARRTLGEHVTAQQREAYQRGDGGHLEPCLVVDKAPDEIASFEALCAESRKTDVDWDIVFASTMSGRGGIPPASDEADQPLRFMLKAITEGQVSELAAFDHGGNALRFLATGINLT